MRESYQKYSVSFYYYLAKDRSESAITPRCSSPIAIMAMLWPMSVMRVMKPRWTERKCDHEVLDRKGIDSVCRSKVELLRPRRRDEIDHGEKGTVEVVSKSKVNHECDDEMGTGIEAGHVGRGCVYFARYIASSLERLARPNQFEPFGSFVAFSTTQCSIAVPVGRRAAVWSLPHHPSPSPSTRPPY